MIEEVGMNTRYLVLLLALSASMASAEGRREAFVDTLPLVEPAPIAVSEAVLASVPFREGLPVELLPPTAGGAALDPESVVQSTTSCGLRTVWGRYDGLIIMLWLAPTLTQAESGQLGVGMASRPDPERLGAKKAAVTIGELRDKRTPAGDFYPAEQVVAFEEDEEGVVWFATEGEHAKFWREVMHQNEYRYSFWWRSGLWVIGVDAPSEELLEAAAVDLVDHLSSGNGVAAR